MNNDYADALHNLLAASESADFTDLRAERKFNEAADCARKLLSAAPAAFTVYAQYDIAPCCISGAHVIETADFAAWAVERGFNGVTDYTNYGGNVEYRNSDRCASPAFVVKVGEYADRAVAEACALAIRVAGRSTC
jgi:hypothetical protein